MKREVEYKEHIIKYDLQRKKVKNINMRIKPDFTVFVSANPKVSVNHIDNFVISKADFILSAFESFKLRKKLKTTPKFNENEFVSFTNDCFGRVYNLFKYENIVKPQLKFRTMKSRWGSCNYSKGIITLNNNLIYCTEEQIYYVIVHEFSHLIVHNHSKDFYSIVEKYCKDYKRIRREMNKIYLEN